MEGEFTATLMVIVDKLGAVIYFTQTIACSTGLTPEVQAYALQAARQIQPSSDPQRRP